MARSHYIYVVTHLDGELRMFTVKWEMEAYMLKKATKPLRSVTRYTDGSRDVEPVDMSEVYL